MSNTKIYNKIFVILFLGLIGFACMAIASKNSFLYKFNESLDVNVFVVTVRGMLKGQTLYKDIYDHKGPFLYFIYVLGMWIKNDSFIGIYVIEGLFFTWYLYYAYKTIGLFETNEYVKLSATAVVAVISSGSTAIRGGGQCEEFALPFLMIIIFYTISYFQNTYPNPISLKHIFLIGICTAVIFWMKYLLLGMVAGLVFAIVVLVIKNKQIGLLWKYSLLFVLGFLVATLPVMIYHILTRSVGDLFQVYFWDNIFKYRGIDYNVKISLTDLLFGERSVELWLGPLLCIYLTLASGLMYKKQRTALFFTVICMMLGMCVGITTGHVWVYSVEIICVFAAVGLGMTFAWMRECGRVYFKYAKKFFKETRDNYLGNKYDSIIILLISVIFAAIVRKRMIACFVCAIIVCCLCKYAIVILGRFRFGFLIRYVLMITVYKLIDHDYVMLYWMLAFALMLICDAIEFLTINRNIFEVKQINKTKKIVANILLCFATFEIVILSMLSYVRYADDRDKSINESPGYQMAQYIKESGCENPIVINYDCLDNGVYWFLDEYPTSRRFASNNADESDIEEIANEWIVSRKADFVISSYFEPKIDKKLLEHGYELVYFNEVNYFNTDEKYAYRMYQKNDEL